MSFIRESKRPLMNMHLRVQRCVPGLAIEIASANDTFEKLAQKARRYRNCGTAEVWILSAETIPGFAIRLGDLFSRC